MRRTLRLGIAAAAVVVVLLALILKHGAERDADDRATVAANAPAPAATATPPPAPAALPRLVDVGAGTCVPCKMMAPILDELGREYAGVFKVDVYDLRQNREAAAQYGVRVIPTQIFYDAAGRELFRHEGFFAKDDIVAKWRELGVPLPTADRS